MNFSSKTPTFSFYLFSLQACSCFLNMPSLSSTYRAYCFWARLLKSKLKLTFGKSISCKKSINLYLWQTTCTCRINWSWSSRYLLNWLAALSWPSGNCKGYWRCFCSKLGISTAGGILNDSIAGLKAAEFSWKAIRAAWLHALLRSRNWMMSLRHRYTQMLDISATLNCDGNTLLVV